MDFFPANLHMFDCLSPIYFVIKDLKYEENSVKAVQCLNDMVTNALMHAEDCLKYMSNLRDLAIFRFCAIPQVLFFSSITSGFNIIFPLPSLAQVVYQHDLCLDICLNYMSSYAVLPNPVNGSFLLHQTK